jgi:hypothetical protein
LKLWQLQTLLLADPSISRFSTICSRHTRITPRIVIRILLQRYWWNNVIILWRALIEPSVPRTPNFQWTPDTVTTWHGWQGIKKTPWLQSASELYRPSDRRLSTKLMPTFLRIEGATWSAWRIPMAVCSAF